MSERVESLEDVVTTLRSVFLGLAAHFGVEEIRVFGSIVSGRIHARSDVDLIVKFYRVPTLLELSRLDSYLYKQLGRSIDIVLDDPVNEQFLKYTRIVSVKV